MNIREFSSQFKISIFSQNADVGSQIKFQLAHVGYDCHFFADLDHLLQANKSEPSHIIVCDLETSILPVHELIQKCLDISTEIKFILLTRSEKINQFSEYKKYNTDFVLSISEPCISDQVLWAVDNVCENIYRIYQNEQIYEELDQITKKYEKLQLTLNEERSSSTVRPYQTRISQYRTATSKENILDIFYQQSPMQSWVYLKYVLTIQTFLCVSYHSMPDDWIEGISFKIPNKEKDFITQLCMGQMPQSFETYLLQKFNVSRIKFLPMIVGGKIEGLLISTQEISAEVAEDFSLMSLVYELNFAENKTPQIEIEDNFTGFYNRGYYLKILDREIDQAKRILQPLSVIKLSIDKLAELEISQGRRVADEVLREVADQLKFSSRISDYICRTDTNEFALVLVNCSRKGAAIRAERVRMGVNQAKIHRSGLDISISQGICEYPSLSHDAISLDESATKALKFIANKGGDKICISKASQNHTPDFVVEN